MHLSPPPPPTGGLGCCPFWGGGSVVVDLLFIVTPIVGVCNCSMFCCTLLYVPSSFAIILMEKRELVALLSLSSWCLVIVVWLFLEVPWVCLQFVIVAFNDHTHLLFFIGYIGYLNFKNDPISHVLLLILVHVLLLSCLYF